MEQKKTLLVGIDLDNEFTQLACCDQEDAKLIPIVFSGGREKIATAIGVEEATKKWLIGADMEALLENESGDVVDGLLAKLLGEEKIPVLTASFAPEEILERFLRRCLLQVKEQVPGYLIAKLIVTVTDTSSQMRERLSRVFAKLGLLSDRLVFITRGQSFGEYVLKHRKEVFGQTVALFDYRKSGMHYSQVRLNTKRRPVLLELQGGDLSDVLPYQEDFDYADAFAETAAKLFARQTVMRVYATGVGFANEEIAGKALGRIAQGRKVFLGDNLYVNGACYFAQRLMENQGSIEAMSRDYLVMAEETVPYEVSMDLFYRGRTENIVVLEPGINWCDVKKTFDFILDDTDQLDLTLLDALTGSKSKASFFLDGLEKRPRKMTRVRVVFDYEDVDTMHVVVTDFGFGEWYPATGRTWEFRLGGLKA